MIWVMSEFSKCAREVFGDGMFTVADLLASTVPLSVYPVSVQYAIGAVERGQKVNVARRIGWFLRQCEDVERVSVNKGGVVWRMVPDKIQS